MKSTVKKSFLILFASLLFTQIGFAQFEIPEIPKEQTSVYDYANILSPEEKVQLEEKLVRYSDSTTTQIVVITIESLKGEDVSLLATNWGQKWGIGGTAKDDNGVVILLAKAEKKIAINPGYGVEDRLTAGIGGEIIRNIIVPEFKAGSFALAQPTIRPLFDTKQFQDVLLAWTGSSQTYYDAIQANWSDSVIGSPSWNTVAVLDGMRCAQNNHNYMHRLVQKFAVTTSLI